MVSASAEAALSEKLGALERATGKQFVVALFQSLEGESLEDYSNKLFRHWRIGDAKRNDGLLFTLFVSDRKWRVEVGYGLEGALTDLEAGALVRDYATPALRAGDNDAAVSAAVDVLSAKLGGGAMPARPQGRRARLDAGVAIGWILIFVLVAILVNRPRTLGRRYGSGDWSDWGSGGGWGSGGWSGGGGGGFSGGGGSSGGGGASGSW